MGMFNVQGYELRKQLLKGKPSCLPKEVEQKPEVKDLKSNIDGIAEEYYGTLGSKKEDLIKEYYEAMSTMNRVDLGIIRRDGTIENNEEAKITADTETKSMENTDTTSECTDVSNNTNSNTGGGVASQSSMLLDFTIQQQAFYIRIIELSRKQMKIRARLNEIEAQIDKLKSLPQNNQNIQQLKDLQEEKNALKRELNDTRMEVVSLKYEIKCMEDKIQNPSNSIDYDASLFQ